MERLNLNRLLHTLLPFMVMVLVQRLLLLVLGHFGWNETLTELCAFLPAAAAGALLFRVPTYRVVSADDTGAGEADGAGEEIPPLTPVPAFVCLLRLITTAAALVLLMFVTAALMGNSMAADWRETARNAAQDTGLSSVDLSGTALAALSSLSVLLLHPVAEEYVFRRLFYGELRRMNPIFGCLAQAVMFAIMHNSIGSMIYALAAGMTLAVSYERTGTLWVPILAHVFINARSLIALAFLSDAPVVREALDLGLLILGLAAIAADVILQRRPEPGKEQPEPEERHD